MLILAFDTATDIATSALVDDGELLGERASIARTLLEDVDALLRQASARATDLDAVAVGTGPGSFTSTRMGIAIARGLALALDIPVAGVSTLDALAASGDAHYPVIDARRGEVFVPGPRAVVPADVAPPAGAVCVGDGAARYRDVLEAAGVVRGAGERRGTPPACPLPRRARHGLRACGARRARLRPRSRRRPAARVTVTMRRLELSDLDAVERIERASYPAPWSRAMFAGELAKPSSLSLAALNEEDDLVGYLVLSRYVDAWHVMNLAVEPDWRRRGIGSALLERLLIETKGDTDRGYTLEVRVSNIGAIRLYERFGFRARGVRRGYYTDNREDALVMWRDPAAAEEPPA